MKKMLENHNILTYSKNTKGQQIHLFLDLIPFFKYVRQDILTDAKFIPGQRAPKAAKRGATNEIRLRERSIKKTPDQGEDVLIDALNEHFKNNHNYF